MADLEELKQNMDTINKNNTIEVQELEDFLQSNENIQALGEAMNSNASPELVEEMENVLKDLCIKILSQTEISENQEHILNYFSNNYQNKYPELINNITLNYELNNFINSQNITSQSIVKVNEWNNLFGDTNIEQKRKLLNSIETKIKNIQQKYAETLAIKGNDPYSLSDIQLIQLRANLKYGENFQINPNLKSKDIKLLRGNFFRDFKTQTQDQQKLNTYIYTTEITNRGIIIDYRREHRCSTLYENILNIKNLDTKLSNLSPEAQQNILTKFMEFFLQIKHPGKSFEDKIGGDNLEKVLDNFICAELYKDTSMTDFTKKYKDATYLEYKTEHGNIDNEFRTQLEENLKTLQQFSSPTEYYLSVAKQQIENIKNVNQSNIKQNEALILQNGIYTDINQLLQLDTLLSDIKTLISNIDQNNSEDVKQTKETIRNKTSSIILPDNIKQQILLMLDSTNISINVINNCIKTTKKDIYHKIFSSKDYNKLPNEVKEQILLMLNSDYSMNQINKEFNTYEQINIPGEINKIIQKNNERYSELENDIDILNQYNSLKEEQYETTKRNPITGNLDHYENRFYITRNVSFEEYERYWPSDANANRMGLQGTLQNYSGRGWTKNYQDKTKNDVHVPGDIYRLCVPGCENIVVRITNDNITKIKNLLASKRNRQIVLKDFKAKKSGYTKGLGVSNTGYDIQSIKSSNESQIRILGIEDFAIVEESQNGEIILKDLNGQEIKRINKETQNEISKLENDSMKILKTPEIDGLINYRTGKGDTLLNMQGDIDSLLSQMNQAKINWDGVLKKNLLRFAQGAEGNTYDFTNAINETKTVDNPFTKEQVQKIWETAIEMKNTCEIVRKQQKDWENLKERLQEIKSRSNNGLSNELEQYIDGMYNGVCAMLEFIKPNGGLDNLSAFVLNKQNVSAKENASQILRGWIQKNGVVILTSIAFAVAAMCAIPTGGASLLSLPLLSTFFAAAAGTLGGMVGSRAGILLNEGLNNIHKTKIVVDGKEYVINYDSPTDVELFLKGKMTGLDFWKGIGKEFAIGTASTFGFMVAGQRIGQGLSKYCPKLAEKIRPSAFKDVNTQYTDNMFNQIIRQGEKEGFIGRFGHEFLQECGEEAVEQSADAFGEATGLPFIGGLASLYHSLTPSPNIDVLQKSKVSFDTGYTQGGKKMGTIEGGNIHLTVYYDTNAQTSANQTLDDIVKYYHEQGGYEYDPETNTLTKENEDFPKSKKYTNVIHLQPTNASLEARSIVSSKLGEIGMFSVDHKTGENFYNPIFGEIIRFNARERGLGDVTIDSNGILTLTTKDNTTLQFKPKSEEYFGGKSHRLAVTEVEARGNSDFMDNVSELNGEQGDMLQEMKTRIETQYEITTGNELNLTTEQLQTIIEAHKMDGELGNLDEPELKAKRQKLSETISDGDVIRFLFEAGFCGSIKLGTDNVGSIKKMNKEGIQKLINGTFIDYYYDPKTDKETEYEVKIEEMTINDLNTLMWKAANMGLDTETLGDIKQKINERIENIKKGEYNKEHMEMLENNISQISFETEIKNIEINDPNFNDKIKDIEGKINDKFGESKIGQELMIELNKKKFEHYKVNGELTNAKTAIDEMMRLNKNLLSEDITNFKYKRGLLDVELYKIQLGEGDINTVNKAAEELREDTETIGGRTDINTLLSKIEAGILLGKSQEELDVYLSFLAIQENDVGINILGNVISTISNTFPEQELDASAKRIEDAGKASNDNDLKEKGNRARENANKYKEMKKKLEGDKNGIEKKKLQDTIDKFVYEKPINSITDIGNTFMHPLQLFNRGSVASIEISENTYSKTHEILTGKSDINGIKIEGGIDMEGNRDPTEFGDYMKEVNEKLDRFIRILYSTEKLQELNSASHSAGYDANMKSYLEKVGLNDLAQVMEIYGIADCRVHAFTKQILFDTMKRNQLQNLQKKLDTETDLGKREKLEKQIKILKNTKMVYVDSTLTGNTKMRAKYQAEKENGHFIKGKENAIIEEHTFNLIEIPTIDSEGNISGKNAFYADAFYQGSIENGSDTGKVYDLSFNPSAPITTIYDRTYYTKKDGKYTHNPNVNMCMTTEVIGSDGSKISITTVPLSRSVQGRGDNLRPSNIETEVLSKDEVAKRNEETRQNVEAIDKITKIRSDILHPMKEALRNGDIEKLEDILENGIESDIYYNTENGKRENSKGKVKIDETQAKFIKRAIEICIMKGNISLDMQESLNKMFDHIVTQDEVDYRSKSGSATDVEERMGVFWDSMQVFNDVYKAEIEEAIKQLDPKNINSIKGLQAAIRNYQEIYDSDMKDFLERNQKTTLNEKERNQEYHRNNFEHIAKRFQSDMEMYGKVIKNLENLGLYEQAFEIKKYMVNQGNTLLDHSDKLLGHMIDFKKIKKAMKGIEGREVYIQLKEIQAKGIGNVEAELKKRGMNPDNIKEMVGIDADKPFNSEILSEAISNIEESGLKEYYDTIALVFNPEILAINMENAVYSKGGYETESGERLFNSESKEEYVARKYAELEILTKINDNITSGEIGQIISNEILDKIDPSLLTGKSKGNIQTEIQHLADLCTQCGIKGQEAYNICKKATEALIFQTAESQTRIMGDHGINHISGNIQKLDAYLEAGIKGGKIPQNEIGKYKLMGSFTHIFHDIGYAATISKGSGSFDGSAIHPFTSKAFFDSNIKPLLEGTGINTTLISQSIEAHDGTRLDFSTPETTFLSMVNLSDNMALGVDKMAQIWSNPKLLNHIATLYALDAAGIDLKQSDKIIAENIRNDSSITPTEQESLISAVNELSGRGLDNIDFWSVSPLTAMEFIGNVPTLSMYKGANLMLVAEVCGIQIETQYDAEGNKKIGLKEALETKNKTRIIELIHGTKFCSQIVKPLGDYADNYKIMDSNGHEYPKTNGKYNMDEIKADLLLGQTVSLNDGRGTILKYKYEESTNESILAEKNSTYGHIDTAEMLGKGVEAMKKITESSIIHELASLNKTMEGILYKIKNAESINTKEVIDSIDATINTLEEALTSADITEYPDFQKMFKTFKKTEIESLFKTYLTDNKYSELKIAAKAIQEDIGMLSSLLVKETEPLLVKE